MGQRVGEAIVLRTWPFEEADLLVSLLTREQGRIKGVARHAMRSRRRFGGALEPMTYVRASYAEKPKQELVRLDSFEILWSPLKDPIDYERTAALEAANRDLSQALKDKEVLLMEVHHRVKNNLQVITSLLSMQARSFGDPALTEAYNAGLTRIFAMSRVHELLYQSEHAGTLDLDLYLESLAQDLRRLHESDGFAPEMRMTVKGSVQLGLDKITPVALIAEVPLVVIARKDFPADNLKDFVAYSKANAAKMTFGSAGAGSATHLGCVVLDTAMGTKITHVPSMYLSELPAACSSLEPLSTIIVEVNGGQLCRNDRFRAVQPGTSIPGGYCVFGRFTPYSQP